MFRTARPPRGGPVPLAFRERLSGPFVMGVTNPLDGARLGRATRWRLTVHVEVSIDDIKAFVRDPHRTGALSGAVELPGVPGRIAVDRGVFRPFPPRTDGDRTLIGYEWEFTDDGTPYRLMGEKLASRRITGAWSDSTTLHARLYRGEGAGELVGAGVLRVRAAQVPRMLTSMRAPGARVPVAAMAVASYCRLFGTQLLGAYRKPRR